LNSCWGVYDGNSGECGLGSSGVPRMWQHRLQNSIARRGMWATLRMMPRGGVDAIVRGLGFRERDDEAGREFDRQLGISTCGRIPLGELTVHSGNVLCGRLYSPVSITILRSLIDNLRIPHAEFSFVDFGSGMGRVALFAATHPFKEVRGGEFAQELRDVAVDNANRTAHLPQRQAPVHFDCMDAVDYPIPDGNLVCFFFNPFEAPIMKKVVGNLTESLRRKPRKCYLIYVRPLFRAAIEAYGIWTTLEVDETHAIYLFDGSRAAGE